jgi:serine/threonine protein kinase
MSPEQAELSPLDVDTRADVYALGVLLYELLTGTTPLDPTRLREAGLADTLKAIREEEPTRPSTRVAERRKAERGQPIARTRSDFRLPHFRDLDWVVMKCLEKDRTRRYETVNALARDVERFLADEPVDARPPSVGYRVRKPDARAFRASLCRILLALDELEEALPYLDDLLSAERGRLGPNTANLANLLTKHGRTLLDHRRFAAAEKLLREAQDIRDGNEKAKNALPTFINRSLLGQSLLGQGNYEAAEPLLRGGYDGLKARQGTALEAVNAHLPETADALIRLYHAWGKPDDAAEWRKERANHPPEQLPPPRPAR